MRIVLLSCCALVLAGCAAGGDNSTASRDSMTAATSTASTTASPPASSNLGKFAEEWKPKFAALPKSTPPSTCGSNASTQACAEHLTKYVVLVGELESAIKGRSDKSRYAGTLAEIEKVRSAGDSYGEQKCRLYPVRDSAGSNLCERYVTEIVTGALLVDLKLQSDDLTS